MGQLVDRDLEHLNLLKIGYYIMAGLAAFVSLFALVYVGLGGLFAAGGMNSSQNSGPDMRVAGMIFMTIGSVLLFVGLCGAALLFFAARCLRDRRHRVFCIVMACLTCLHIPWGTAIGIAAISVLSRPSVKALFDAGPQPQPVS